MGRLMSANLERAGFVLRTFDLNGSGNCRSPAQAAKDADLLITMLPDGKAVRRAVIAALPGLAPGSIVVDMSSSDPFATRRLQGELAKKKVALLDAPVSGSKTGARDATLAIMAGGDAAALERARPVLEKLGKTIFHMGALGAGHATKALNNYVGASGTIAAFHALLIGQAFGLDRKHLNDVFNASTGYNSTTQRKIPLQILTGAYASGFSAALMAKDVGIAREISRRVGVRNSYLEETLRIWRGALRRLPVGADHSEMYRFLEGSTPPSRAAASRRAARRRRPRRASGSARRRARR
jgi:3-hydroxyisobutyrate dehydrogenase